MGLGDLISSALGESEKPPRTKAASVKYFMGKALDGGENSSKQVSTNDPNGIDKPSPISFIHCGRLHPDSPLNFHHDPVADDQRADFGGEGDGVAGPKNSRNFKAMMFRDALEREAILLSAFVAEVQAVLKECKDNKGAMGEVMDVAGSLLGGGGSKGPDPAEFDDILSDISLAGGLVNKTPIAYKDIYKAGKDLRQVRCDYSALVQKFSEQYIKPSDSGSPISMPAAPGPLGSVQGIAFKAFDVYAASFFSIRGDLEGKVMRACHAMTIEGIEDRYTKVFPVWFFRWSDNVPPEKKKDEKRNIVEQAVEKVNEEIDKAKKALEEKQKSVQDFLGIENDEPMAGEKYLKAMFGALGAGGGEKSEKDKTDKEKKGAGGAPGKILEAFKVVIGSLPGFVEGMITEIAEANLGMMEVLYRKVLLDRAEAPIDKEFMLVAGREYLSHRMINLLAKMSGVGFLQEGAGPLVKAPGVGGVGGDQIKDKAAGLLDATVMSKIEFIISIAVNDLHGKIEGARTEAAGAKSLTLETFLGRLPWFYTLMFRNTFFPLWDIVAEKLFGTANGLLGAVTSPVKSALGSVQSAVGDVKDAVNTASTVAENMQKIDNEKIGQLIDDPMAAMGLGGGGADAPPPPAKFPGSPREPMAEGTVVTKEEIDQFKSDNIVVLDPDTDKDEDW
ncbi:MAG TPA: hypothetical protein VKO67_06430 [Smithellaceae bacterium]|nr:hypothetical protein [Smithellaceae bacterium]